MALYPFRLQRGHPYVAPTLADITLSALTAPDNVLAGSTLAFFNTGFPAGTTVTISPNDGRITVNNSVGSIERGGSAWADGPIALTFTATNAPYGNSPHTSPAITFTVTNSALPTVAPGAGWTGTAGSGGYPAVFGGNVTVDPITRTTAKPAISWVVPSGMVLNPSENIVIGVDADASGAKCFFTASIAGTLMTVTALATGATANLAVGFKITAAGVSTGTTISSLGTGTGGTGTYNLSASQGTVTSEPMCAAGPSGIKQIDFWVEGTTQTVTVPQFLTWTQNGVSKTCWGYFIQLQQSDFAAHLSGSEARIFATAIPNDTTMQNRVLGYDLQGTSTYDGNWPLYILPRSAANDHAYTVNPANNDVSPNFTTIKKAMTQAATDSAERPLLTFTATAAYEAENLTNHVPGSKAFCTLTCAGGVTATIGRAAAFSPTGDNSWTPGWDAIEFRGSGVVFQQLNWTTCQLSRSSWFNGNKWTNSVSGGRDNNFYNGAGAPYVGTGSLMCWCDGTYSEVCSGMMLNNFYAIGCQVSNTGGSCFTGNWYLYNTYVKDFSNAYFDATTARLNITGPANSTAVRAAGAHPDFGQNLLLQVSGTTVHTVLLGFASTDANPNLTALAATINGFGGGWSATVLNDGALWQSACLGFNISGTGDWSFNVATTGAGFDFNCLPDPHGEWVQEYGLSVFQNVIWRNNILNGNPADTVLQIASPPFASWDHVMKGNTFINTDGPPGGMGTGPTFGGAWSHFVFENNNIRGAAKRVDDAGTGDFVYSSYSTNVTGPMYTTDGSHAFLNSPPWINTAYCKVNSNGSMIGAGFNIGNVEYDAVMGGNHTAVYDTLYTSVSTMDLRPVAAGFLLSNLVPKINTYDGRGLAFASTDTMGSWSKNDAQYIPPF